jgi:hypothetical protein
VRAYRAVALVGLRSSDDARQDLTEIHRLAGILITARVILLTAVGVKYR